MTKMTQKEAKRLRKSVKRRRTYAESLRASAKDLRASAEASGDREDARFADRLDKMATDELAYARVEETQAIEIERPVPKPYGGFSSADQKVRHEGAMAAMEGRTAIDRIVHLLAHHKIERNGDNNIDMAAVEALLGLTAQVNPEGQPRLQLGRRIDLAETVVFGAPRF